MFEIFFVFLSCALEGIYIVEEKTNEIDDTYISDSVKAYLRKIGSIPLLTKEQQYDLIRRAQNNDIEARNLLIESNLKLVVSIAKRYGTQKDIFLDLIQEENIGLNRAIEKFDLSTNFNFSTYAIWWVRQAISKTFKENSRTIRISNGSYQKIAKFKKIREALEQQYGREVTTKEIAEVMNININEIKTLEKLANNTTSLTQVTQDSEEIQIEDYYDNSEITMEEQIINVSLSEEIQKLLDNTKLTTQERCVIMLRFGLDGKGPKTLETVGELLGVTRERIRQVEVKALKKIRCSKYAYNLIPYANNPDEALNILSYSKIYFYRLK